MKKSFMFFVVLFFLCIIGCATTEFNNEYEFKSHESGSYKNIDIQHKDFIIKGPIFVESRVTIESNGTKNGSEITSYMLIKEAQKLGADDVVNVKIDKIENIKYVPTENPSYQQTKQIKTYIYQATGLAIKYK